MDLQLREGIHYRICGEQVIFADSTANRYFCLSPGLESTFQALLCGRALDLKEWRGLEALVANGVLVWRANSGPFRPLQLIPVPRAEAPWPADRKCSPALVARVIYDRCTALRSVGSNGIAEISRILSVKYQAAPQKHRRSVDLSAVQAAFELTDRILSPWDRCLARSLAFHVVCKRVGLNTTIVLGVRTNPFSAHCWVESEGLVTTGDFEQVRLFAPIMVLA